MDLKKGLYWRYLSNQNINEDIICLSYLICGLRINIEPIVEIMEPKII